MKARSPTPASSSSTTCCSARIPRWVEDWKDRASSKTLQIDENDLWLVAQAVERNYRLITSDNRLIKRFVPAIPELRHLVL